VSSSRRTRSDAEDDAVRDAVDEDLLAGLGCRDDLAAEELGAAGGVAQTGDGRDDLRDQQRQSWSRAR